MRVIRRLFFCKRYNDSNNILFKDIKRLKDEHAAIVIDVRSVQEYQESHYNGAINIPVWDIKNKIFDVTHDKEEYIVLYCSSGIRSKKAQRILKSIGFENVFNITDNYI